MFRNRCEIDWIDVKRRTCELDWKFLLFFLTDARKYQQENRQKHSKVLFKFAQHKKKNCCILIPFLTEIFYLLLLLCVIFLQFTQLPNFYSMKIKFLSFFFKKKRVFLSVLKDPGVGLVQLFFFLRVNKKGPKVCEPGNWIEMDPVLVLAADRQLFCV